MTAVSPMPDEGHGDTLNKIRYPDYNVRVKTCLKYFGHYCPNDKKRSAEKKQAILAHL